MADPEIRILYESSIGDNRNLPYLKWINEMRGQMPPARESLCSELFQLLDKRGQKNIKVEDFERRYYPELSYQVKEGRKTSDDLMYEMGDRIDLFGRLGGYDFKSGVITYDEYMEFWDNVSSIIKDDKEFENMMRECFIN